MKLTKKQIEQIIELVEESLDYEVEVNGPGDYDIHGYVPTKNIDYIWSGMQQILKNTGLEELFELQRALQKKIDFSNMPLIQYIRLMFIGIVTEACEAIEQTDWKPWKQSTGVNPGQSKNFKKEIIDIWHFLINLTIASGMDADNVLEMFRAKNKINIERQERKY